MKMKLYLLTLSTALIMAGPVNAQDRGTYEVHDLKLGDVMAKLLVCRPGKDPQRTPEEICLELSMLKVCPGAHVVAWEGSDGKFTSLPVMPRKDVTGAYQLTMTCTPLTK
jgi:hypothetical protein